MNIDTERQAGAITGPHDAIICKDSIKEDGNRRTFWGVASAEVIDKEGELIPLSAMENTIKDYIKRGGPLTLQHSNRIIGRVVDYKTDEEDGVKRLLVKGEIHSGYDVDDETWEAIKSGDLPGLSIGFEKKDSKTVCDSEGCYTLTKDINLYEISAVDNPANQEAEILAVNHSAKGDKLKQDLDYKQLAEELITLIKKDDNKQEKTLVQDTEAEDSKMTDEDIKDEKATIDTDGKTERSSLEAKVDLLFEKFDEVLKALTASKPEDEEEEPIEEEEEEEKSFTSEDIKAMKAEIDDLKKTIKSLTEGKVAETPPAQQAKKTASPAADSGSIESIMDQVLALKAKGFKGDALAAKITGVK